MRRVGKAAFVTPLLAIASERFDNQIQRYIDAG
jgi:hypothetical protein